MTPISGGKLISLPVLALVMAMILWSSSFIALKIAFRAYDPMFVIFGRMFVASLCFLVVGKRIANSLTYRKGDYKLIIFMAFCEPCLYFIFEAKAVENTTASQAGIITAMLPILVMIAATLFLKERVSKKAWIGALIAITGVLWLTAESSPSSDAPNPVLGNFLEFLAMVCATGYTISLKSLTERYSPFFLTAIQALIGSIFYFPLLFLPSTELPQAFVPVSAMAIIYLGAVITLGAYGLFNYGIKYVPASKGSVYANLVPIFSVILGWLVLGESLTLYQFFAGTLILAGVYLSQKQ
ncbi:MAG: drug/metabolite transporter (DMT)-like permease [Desulforhopalus sp.]|jgi:drug/metabolite transporter (DMT)-like permease